MSCVSHEKNNKPVGRGLAPAAKKTFANETAGVNPRPTKIDVQNLKMPRFCVGTNVTFEQDSKADFINKLEISLKECSETEYWLELIFRKGKITEPMYKDLRNKGGSIRRRLIASITTAKSDSNGKE